MIEFVIEAGKVAGAGVGIGAFMLGGWKFWRRLVHIADAVSELVPNGGSSIKDQVTRSEQQLARIEQQLAQHLEQHKQHEQGVA